MRCADRVLGLAVAWLLLGSCGKAPEAASEASKLSIATTEYEVVVPHLGCERDVVVRVLNQGVIARKVQVVGVSCGCVQALDTAVTVAPGGCSEVILRTRPIMFYKKRHSVLLACPETEQSWHISVTASADQGVCVDPPEVDIVAPIAPGAVVSLGRLVVACESGQQPELEYSLSPATEALEIVLTGLREVRDQNGVRVLEAEVSVVGVAEAERVTRRIEFRSAAGGEIRSATMAFVVSVKEG